MDYVERIVKRALGACIQHADWLIQVLFEVDMFLVIWTAILFIMAAIKKNPATIELPYATAVAVRNTFFGPDGKDYSVIINDLGGDLIAELTVGALVTGKAPQADPRPRRESDRRKRVFVRYSFLKDEVQYQIERYEHGEWIMESHVRTCSLLEWEEMSLFDEPVAEYTLAVEE